MDKEWTKVLNYIKAQISNVNFKAYFALSSLDLLSDQELTISVSSTFIKTQLSARFLPLIEEAVESVFGKRLLINFKIDSSKLNQSEEDSDLELDFIESPVSSPSMLTLNRKYTLENFVVGLSNNLAYAAAQAIVQSPGTSYNPLFIYGGTGVGKTHLMHGIGNALSGKRPSTKIIYCSSEKFTNDFVQSIQTKRTGDFRAKYRSCDLFLVDDIQFISGRDSTQEEFFHTFNELQAKNSQIVLTSDRPPHEMQAMEARLLSRFQGGLMVDIQLPDFDTRVAILRGKCAEKSEIVPEEVLTLLAENISTNARELEGKLIQILQSAKLANQELTLDLARQLLGKPTHSMSKPDYRKVITSINQYFKIKMVDLTGPRRKKELVIPRQITMYLLYEECKLPFEKIGDLLGGRDHSTIIHGVEKIRQSSARDREIQRILIELRQSFQN